MDSKVSEKALAESPSIAQKMKDQKSGSSTVEAPSKKPAKGGKKGKKGKKGDDDWDDKPSAKESSGNLKSLFVFADMEELVEKLGKIEALAECEEEILIAVADRVQSQLNESYREQVEKAMWSVAGWFIG